MITLPSEIWRVIWTNVPQSRWGVILRVVASILRAIFRRRSISASPIRMIFLSSLKTEMATIPLSFFIWLISFISPASRITSCGTCGTSDGLSSHRPWSGGGCTAVPRYGRFIACCMTTGAGSRGGAGGESGITLFAGPGPGPGSFGMTSSPCSSICRILMARANSSGVYLQRLNSIAGYELK